MADEGLISLEKGSSSSSKSPLKRVERMSSRNRGWRAREENKNWQREKNCSQVEHNSKDMNGESFSRLNDCVNICVVGEQSKKVHNLVLLLLFVAAVGGGGDCDR